MENFRQDNTVYVLVGPSGSGKSTMIANMYSKNIFGNSATDFVPFINRHYSNTALSLLDEINLKKKLLAEGKSFLIESANFDKTYADFIKSMKTDFGYNVCLLYLTKRNPLDNMDMVKKRRSQGGHGRKDIELNIEKLKDMYLIDAKNLREVMPYCDSCFVVDNTTKTQDNSLAKPILLMHKKLSGEIVYNKETNNTEFLYNCILKYRSLRAVKTNRHVKFHRVSDMSTRKVYITKKDAFKIKSGIVSGKEIVELIDEIIEKIKKKSQLAEKELTKK